MGVTEDALQELADDVEDFGSLEIPVQEKWNQGRNAIQAGFPLIGGEIDTLRARIDELEAKFFADHDDTTGKNPVPSEWVAEAAVPTFLDASRFRLPGNRLADFADAERLRAALGATLVVVAITGRSHDGVGDATTITVTPPVLTSGLTRIDYGLVRRSVPRQKAGDYMPLSISTNDVAPAAIIDAHLAPLAVTAGKIADLAVTTGKLADAAVTTPKIAVGATIVAHAVASGSNNSTPAGQTETIATAAIQSRGGRVVALAGLFATNLNANATVNYELRRKVGAGAFVPVLARQVHQNITGATALNSIPCEMELSEVPPGAAGETVTYELRALNVGSTSITSDSIRLEVLEYA